MKRALAMSLVPAAVLAAGIGGYEAGRRDLALPGWARLVSEMEPANASPEAGGAAKTGRVIYYRDPDGRPFYSAAPRKTADGREFLAVYAGEDVSLDTGAPVKEAASATPGADKGRVLYYRNPMGLPDTSPTPKKDSMGMDYIPVYESEGAGGSSIKVAVGRLQQTGVRTATAVDKAIVASVRVPGTIQLDERRVTVVSTRADAFVNKVAEVTTGDRVTKGQALLQLYAPEIAAAGAQFLNDLGAATHNSTLGGARQRLENLGVPPDAIAEIEQTRKVPLSITWRASRDGIVLQRNAVEGMKAASGDVLFRIADISTIWIVADVPEYQLGAVKVGAAATVRLRSLPGRTFGGRVTLIYPQVATATRTTKVRIELANPDGVLLPDMYADVEIASGSDDRVVAVPDSAVISTGTRQVVIVDKGEGRFEPRAVEVGRQGGGFTDIRAGVASGDKVVVAANFLIDAESNLKAALSGMTGEEVKP